MPYEPRLSEQQAIRRLWKLGHFFNPAFPLAKIVRQEDIDAGKVSFRDAEVKAAVQSYQSFMLRDLIRFGYEEHARRVHPDGEVGPATRHLIEMQRCAVPDFAVVEEAQGTNGNWKGCHNVGDFHCCLVLVNRNNMPSGLVPQWEEVKKRTTRAYADIGLLVKWTEDRSDPWNTELSFVTSSSGWIGLALVQLGLSCSTNEREWLKLLASFMNRAPVQDNTSLVMHELGHNTGLQHTSGGVMNPSIVRNLDNDWIGDPSEPALRKRYGGQKVPIPGDDVPPDIPVPPGPPTGVVRGEVKLYIAGMGEREFNLVPKVTV